MDWFRKLLGASDDKKPEPAPRPKFVPPPLPEPPVDGIITMNYVRQMLDEIRVNPQHTQQPRWAYVFDYFYADATPAERQELIETVSNDSGFWQWSYHVKRQTRDDQINPSLDYFRRDLISLVLDNGRSYKTPCEIPIHIDRQINLAKRRGFSEQYAALLQEIAEMATVRIGEIFLTRTIDPAKFTDLDVAHCDDIPPEAFDKIADDTVRAMLVPLRVAYLNSDAWLNLADFWREQASPEQRRLITAVIRGNKLYDVPKHPSDFDLLTQDPQRYVEFRLTLTAMQDAAPDWREESMRLDKTLTLARRNQVSIKSITSRLSPISAENAQKVLRNLW